MVEKKVDKNRRKFLTNSVTFVGGAGAAIAMWPFLASMKPSARARAAGGPVEVDISKMEPGQKIDLIWRKKPIWIIRRTSEMVRGLEDNHVKFRDTNSDNEAQQPDFAKNRHRSINPEYLVLEGICTHLGCNPSYRPEIAPADLGKDWSGGFFCACHGSRFDLAGRVYRGVPAGSNLKVPPHKYLSATRIIIGVMPDQEVA